ncbi:MAG: endonuclease V [Euryarchaeota archaeon]|nr:endonuclease V [Euryarchaeota archaeon]
MDTKRLEAVQAWVAERARIEDDYGPLDRIAGVDVAYSGDRCAGGAVVLDRAMRVLEERTAIARVRFPYVPTYLTFRELGGVLRAVKGLDFDMLLLDGQGVAHPRRAGLATHVGVVLDRPTVGVAKGLLWGRVEGEPEVGRPLPITCRGQTLGYAVRTRKGTKPVFVSPGHRVSPEGALELVLSCLKGYRLPEPVRLAHILAGRARDELLKND